MLRLVDHVWRIVQIGCGGALVGTGILSLFLAEIRDLSVTLPFNISMPAPIAIMIFGALLLLPHRINWRIIQKSERIQLIKRESFGVPWDEDMPDENDQSSILAKTAINKYQETNNPKTFR